MTIDINDVAARGSWIATAGQTTFPTSFFAFEASDVLVYQNGVLLTYPTQYTVTGAGTLASCTVVLATGAALSDSILAIRSVPYETSTYLNTTGPLQINSLNTFLARIIAMIQQIRDSVGRQLELGITDTDGAGAYEAGGNRIEDLGAPVAANDAVRKAELDAAVLAAGNVPVPAGSGLLLRSNGAVSGAFAWSTLAAAGVAPVASPTFTGTAAFAALTSSGAATFASGGFTGNATVGGTLGVTGLATLASLAVTGVTTLTGQLVANGGGYAPISAIGNTSGTITLNMNNGSAFSLTLNANATNTLAAPSNAVTGQCFLVYISQDATGARALAFASVFDWENGVVPALSTAANAIDVLICHVRAASGGTPTSIFAQLRKAIA